MLDMYRAGGAFLGWLDDFDECEIVGLSVDAAACPVAKFLNAMHQALRLPLVAEVGSVNLVLRDTDTQAVYQQHVPCWMALFVDHLDANHHQRIEPVTAGVCQQIQREVLALIAEASTPRQSLPLSVGSLIRV
jgi:hypothetical protein